MLRDITKWIRSKIAGINDKAHHGRSRYAEQRFAAIEQLEQRLPLSVDVTNVGVSASWVELEGDLVAMSVEEWQHNYTDFNGDGDGTDAVLHLFDTSSGTTVNLEIDSFDPLRVDGNLLAFKVRETKQGSSDLNGDGDASDLAVHIYDAGSGVMTNLGRATTRQYLQLDSNRLAFSVSESLQGNTDLNGDGDALDVVLHVFDAGSGITTNLGLANAKQANNFSWEGFRLDGNLLAFSVSESDHGNTDFNGDGDALDDVLHVLDVSTSTLTNVGLDYDTDESEFMKLSGNLVAFGVRESYQGNTDLNGDGDTADRVLHVFDAGSGTTTNLGLDTVGYFQLEGNLLAFAARESEQGGTDLNGDGDAADRVLHVFDAASGTTTNVGLAAPGALLTDGNVVVLGVDEGDQGNTDLNGDGDASDFVLHLFDVSGGTITNVGLAGLPRLQGNLLAFEVIESQQGATDFNSDGDATDQVVHILDIGTGIMTNLGLAGSIRQVDGNLVAFEVYEVWQASTDFNGDGDASDRVPHVYDAGTGTTTNLGIAGSSTQLDGDLLAFKVDERAQDYTDLNGDGDTVADYVVHVAKVDLPPTAADDIGVGFTTNEDSAFTTGNVLANDTDLNSGDVLSIDSIDVTATTGTVVDKGDGTFDYDPNGQFESLAVGASADDTFAYTVTDGTGRFDSATVTITIVGANDAPVASDDTFAVDENSLSGTIVGVVSASDPDTGDSLTYSITAGNAMGAFAIDTGTGEITVDNSAALDYEATPVFSLTVQVEDLGGLTDTATVAINLNDLPDNLPVPDQIEDVADDVDALRDSGVLSNGEANPIINFLNQAIRHYNKGKTAQALHKLEEARENVQDLVDDGDLDPVDGQALIDQIDSIIDQIL